MKKGDYGNIIGVSLKDANGDPYNLTGKTVQLVYRLGGSVYTKTMTVVNEGNGEVSYTFADGDLPDVGQMEYEIVVTGTGVKLTSETMKINIAGTIS